MESDYLERTNGGTSFAGSDFHIYNSLALVMGLRLYAKTGMKVTRGQTPIAMLKTASVYTGKKYKRGEYEQAAQDLEKYAEGLKNQPRTFDKNIPEVIQ